MSATVNLPQPQVNGHATKTARRSRPVVRGKFLFSGEEKLYLKGVTYGPFFPDESGCLYHDEETANRDFALMAANGINAIRTYTVPPVWLLDAAREHGLWVMVGLPWEQHITFLDDASLADAIEQRVREAVRSCEQHPAILCYTIGNEIPSSIVRWHGREKIEEFLKRLFRAVKEEDPEALATYVNFPPTEYLQLDFVDFLSFNVYLENRKTLEAYLARLQNLAGNKPVVMAEVGLDSMRNGEAQQAAVLDWQVRTVFETGCAGVFVFAWTDEWSRGGFEIEDWDFGLTTRARRPKPALRAVSKAFAEVPFARDQDWPSISVIVCSYNGQRTIRETLEHVTALDYPNYEVIVVNDGSTDKTLAIASAFPQIKIISVPNGGLSAARNIGMRAAEGEILAYIDDDAYPDPHWLHYLGMAFRRSSHVAIGGPNIPPPDDGSIAHCVANAPGGPIHVLLSDTQAEHIPGCNFAVRRAALEAIGGFDPLFRVAGDDVDTCWRLEYNGGTLGFCPAAVVWHHRRNSVKAYWKQQRGYGKAEALLERKWPAKYNEAGHLTWFGRLYGTGVLRPVLSKPRIYQGTWGSALFQALYEPAPGTIDTLAQMPEWYLVSVLLLALAALGFAWTPLFLFAPVAAIAIGTPVAQAIAAARRAEFPSGSSPRLILMTAALFLVQPASRMWGRISHGLTPFRRKDGIEPAAPLRRVETLWSEKWRSAEEWLHEFEAAALNVVSVRRGGDYDPWDLEIRAGLAAVVRVRLAVEEHGAGKQLLRWAIVPKVNTVGMLLGLLFITLAVAAFGSGVIPVAFILIFIAAGLFVWKWQDASHGIGAALVALESMRSEP